MVLGKGRVTPLDSFCSRWVEVFVCLFTRGVALCFLRCLWSWCQARTDLVWSGGKGSLLCFLSVYVGLIFFLRYLLEFVSKARWA